MFSRLVLLVTLLLGFSFTAPEPVTAHVSPELQTQRAAQHHIHEGTILEGASCSSTAIGPHALLTASHCELATPTVNIDGHNYQITEILRDGDDHSIFIIPGITFPDFLPVDERPIVEGEDLHGWGWPRDNKDPLYRVGVGGPNLSSEFDVNAYGIYYPAFHGDSGSAVISAEGKIVGVVSLGDESAHTVTFRLSFTPDQLAHATPAPPTPLP
jgi:hypothetical protein